MSGSRRPGLALFLLSLAAMVSCERLFQRDWRVPILVASRAIAEYRERTRSLPATLEDAAKNDRNRNSYLNVQYRSQGEDAFILWISRKDLGKESIGVRRDGPESGDVWGRFDRFGNELNSSWQ